jgi:hypothetical protein
MSKKHKVELYLNGLFLKTIEYAGGHTYCEHICVDVEDRFGSDPTADTLTHRVDFRIGGCEVPGIGVKMFGSCIDPLVYYDPERETLRCHSKRAFLNAAREFGLNVY